MATVCNPKALDSPQVSFLLATGITSQQRLHLVLIPVSRGVRDDPGPGGRRQAELLRKAVHDLQVRLRNGYLGNLLPIPGRCLYDRPVLRDEFLSLLPSGIRLTVPGKCSHVHFRQDPHLFHLFCEPSPLFFGFRLQPLRAGGSLLVRPRLIVVQFSFARIPFQHFQCGGSGLSSPRRHRYSLLS